MLASFVKGFDCVCSETLYYFWMQSFLLQSLSLMLQLDASTSYILYYHFCVCVGGGGRGGGGIYGVTE